MDEQLAQIYGTNQTDNDDLEKTAAAELLVKLAEEEGIDIGSLSDEDVGELVAALYSEGEGEEKTAETVTTEGEEKLAEADYLGRVMAHAYVQEIGAIEKDAARGEAKYIREAVEGLKATKGQGKKAPLLQNIKAWLRGRPGAYSRAKEEASGAFRKNPTKAEMRAGGAGKGDLPSEAGIGTRLRHLGRAAKHVAPELAAGGALAAGGTAAALHKKGSALETLVEKRASEILAQSGWVDQDGDLIPPPEATKEASVLEQTVEVEALKLLEANGYPVEWNQ